MTYLATSTRSFSLRFVADEGRCCVNGRCSMMVGILKSHFNVAFQLTSRQWNVNIDADSATSICLQRFLLALTNPSNRVGVLVKL